MSFDGKVVLITGGSSGIGADAAKHLSSLGANVAIVGRNEKRLSEVADQIIEAGCSIPLRILADVTKDAERIVNETIQHFGKLDVLLNNAGYGIQDNVLEADISEFDRLIDTNVRSIIILTKLCVPHLAKTKGNIINTSSVAGITGFPNFMSYCISKASVNQFTKCCAIDLASMNIRVNAINPTAIRTRFFRFIGETAEKVDEFYDSVIEQQLVARVGEVADTSAAIAFLANNEIASYFTGILLPVDGGLMTA